MKFVGPNEDPELEEVWKELQSEFERLLPFNSSALQRKGLLKKEKMDDLLFVSDRKLKRPYVYLNEQHRFQKEFFLSLERNEQLAYVISKTMNRISDPDNGSDYIIGGLIEIISGIVLTMLFVKERQLSPYDTLKLAIAWMTIGIGLVGFGVYKNVQASSNNEGAILAIQLTDYETLESAYIKEAKYMGYDKLPETVRLKLERANAKLVQAMGRQ